MYLLTKYFDSPPPFFSTPYTDLWGEVFLFLRVGQHVFMPQNIDHDVGDVTTHCLQEVFSQDCLCLLW